MTPTEKLRDVASISPRAAAPWIESLARLGYVSTATVYTLVGLIAFGAAFGRSRQGADSSDALKVILHQPFGRVLLAIVALGLIGYATWRFVSSINDAERQGSSASGIASRAFGFVRGLVYLTLSVEALRMVAANSARTSSGDGHWVRRVMKMPLGSWLVVLAGLILAGYALHQIYQAWSSQLSEHLRLGDVAPAFRQKIVTVSRFGIAARGVVLAILGASIARAAFRGRTEDTTTGDALVVIGSWSHWLLAATGIGLVAFGLYQLVNARYRIIRAA